MNGIDSNGTIKPSGLKIIGRVFNELTIRRFIKKPDTDKYKSWNTSAWVHCDCSCGNGVDVPLYGVTHGHIKSCGHLRTQNAIAKLEEYRDSTHNAIYLTHENKTMNIAEWSRETGIPRSTIMYRLSKDLPIDKVLERKNCNEEKDTTCV